VERDARARGESETVLANWRRRIDRVIVITAPDELKIARYAARIASSGPAHLAAEAEARVRLAHQIPDHEKAARADYVLENTGDRASLYDRVVALWPRLTAESNNFPQNLSLK
jgi:dephospho-CoA kinase